MNRLRGGIACLMLLALAACGQRPPAETAATPAPPATQPGDTSIPVVSGDTAAAASAASIAALNGQFDPARDPSVDLKAAIVHAQRDGKRIILDVGGEWCPWCHLMDRFIEGDDAIRAYRDDHYIWMKVNYSDDNDNAAFLADYPKVKGYPHLFVLDSDGKLLHSQFTGELELGKEQGKGYNRGKFLAFLKQWAEKSQ